MFWISKDLGCGTLKISKIRNKTTGDETYTGEGINDRYYTVQPTCSSIGTINVKVNSGYTYQYIIACGAKVIPVKLL